MLAKQGRRLGGNAVDGWVLDELCREMGQTSPTTTTRQPPLAAADARQACRVKEAVFFAEEAAFLMSPGG